MFRPFLSPGVSAPANKTLSGFEVVQECVGYSRNQSLPVICKARHFPGSRVLGRAGGRGEGGTAPSQAVLPAGCCCLKCHTFTESVGTLSHHCTGPKGSLAFCCPPGKCPHGSSVITRVSSGVGAPGRLSGWHKLSLFSNTAKPSTGFCLGTEVLVLWAPWGSSSQHHSVFVSRFYGLMPRPLRGGG